MHISRVSISNYRNFRSLELSAIPPGVLLVGENGIGKSNFLRALRLVLDSELPDSERQLRQEDICEYTGASLADGVTVRIEVELVGFDENKAACGALDGCFVATAPLTARLTYLYRPLHSLASGSAGASRDNYEFVVFGGLSENGRRITRARRAISLSVLPPLRDAAAELARTTRSPLLEILEATPPAAGVLAATATALDEAMAELRADGNMSSAARRMGELLAAMAGPQLGVDPSLGFTPSDPARLLRAVQLFVDAKRTRTVGQDSTGNANVVLLALQLQRLDIRQQADEVVGTVLAIEEPEAHLHPVLQRQLYGYLLRHRPALMLTTHSPNVAAVAPLESIVLLRRSRGDGTIAVTAAGSNLSAAQRRDVERYMDVSRAELLFCRVAILVEGIAEVYLLPVLARWFGFNLDAHGVVIASVAGTDFLPYRRLLADDALGVFHVVLTDGDRSKRKRFDGLRRAQDIVSPATQASLAAMLDLLSPDKAEDEDLDALGEQTAVGSSGTGIDSQGVRELELQARLLAATDGVFVGLDTLELDVVPLLADSMIDAVCDLTTSDVTAERFASAIRALRDGLGLPQDQRRVMNRIDDLGKGRFAQRLAARIDQSTAFGRAPVELDVNRVLMNADDRLAIVESAFSLGTHGYLLAALDCVSREVRGCSLFDSDHAEDPVRKRTVAQLSASEAPEMSSP